MNAITRNANTTLLQTLCHTLFEQSNLNVQVLRLDLLHPVISGNKWLKLLPWLDMVQQQQLSGFVTKGGPYSNHIHAAAYVAMLHNLTCTVVVKAKEGMHTPTLDDISKWKAKIIYAPADYDNDEKWSALAAKENQLFIPMGGEGKQAAEGVCHYLRDLSIPVFDHVFCPVGTGTTLKGVAASSIAKKRLTGINPGINDTFETLLAETRKSCAASVEIIKHDSLKKFGQWPSFLPEMMNGWFRQWQLPTDLVYTAKMFFIFLDMLENGSIEPGSSCLLIHTGGLQGNRSISAGALIF